MTDTALHEWLEVHLPSIPGGPDYARRVAEDAWEVATMETMSFIARELTQQAAHTTNRRDALFFRNIADLIMRMKP